MGVAAPPEENMDKKPYPSPFSDAPRHASVADVRLRRPLPQADPELQPPVFGGDRAVVQRLSYIVVGTNTSTWAQGRP